MSFLATVGKDFKAVFSWLGSTKGQAVVAGAEGVAESVATAVGVGAPVQAGINLFNNWLAEIVKAESLAAAADEQTGSGATKAAVVLSTMVPQLTAFLQDQGLATANVATDAQIINTALVTALNAIGAAPPLPPG